MRNVPKDSIYDAFNQKKVPLRHQIDLFGTLIGLLLLWTTVMVISSANNKLLEIVVPKEVLMQSPVTINASIPFGEENRVTCNPHFSTFLNNATYFTDAFKQAKVQKAVSEEFLKRPDVSNALKEYTNRTGLDEVIISFVSNKICELSTPIREVGDCMYYQDIQEKCLEKGCDIEGVNLCWWWMQRIIRTLAVAATVFHFLGSAQILLLIFDPPPRGLEKITKLWLCSLFLLLVGILGLILLALTIYLKARYLNQPAISEAFPKYSHVFTPNFFTTFLFVVSDLAFGVIYFYLQVFTPTYPRQASRMKQRRKHFKKHIEKLEIQAQKEI